MKDLHNLLKRQLRRHLKTDVDSLEGPLLDFVNAVNGAYAQADFDRSMLERSLELSSEELMDSNRSLTVLLSELEERVSKRTAELEFSRLALESSEARLRVLYEAAPVGIFQSLPSGRYLYANKCLAQMYGFASPDDLISSVTSIAESVYADSFEREWVHSQLCEEGRLIGYETKRKRKDGSIFWGSLSVQAQLDPISGQITHYDGFLVDITVRKEAENKLKAAKEEAEGANKSKSIFLANMSHEIRTPLSGIIGLTEILLNSPVDERQKIFLQQLKNTSYSLLSLLNDILDFSKIDANKLSIDKSPVHLRELIADCLRLTNVQAQQKNIELLFRASPQVPEVIEGDGERLRQVLLNLISNAIKFTSDGEILVEARFDNIESSHGELSCFVRDTGTGIAADEIDKIFNAFEQVDSSLTRSSGGTGLGLTISSQLISLMGGNLGCESELGVGSSFYFNIPVKVLKKYSLSVTEMVREELSGKRILVIDGNDSGRAIIREILELWDTIVDEAGDLGSAVHLINEAAEEHLAYDIIISSIVLPMAENLGIGKYPDSDFSLILMLSSIDHNFSKHKANAFVYKPVIQSDLLSGIIRSISSDAGVIENSAIPEIQIFHTSYPKRILLVEDTPLNQQIAKNMLEGWGHEIVIAENGQEGFEKYISDDFDMILMDVQMPVMDGMEATRHIRYYEEKQMARRTPVLALTAHALKGDADSCLKAGMDDYISKPINWRALFSKIEQYQSPVGISESCRLDDEDYFPVLDSFDESSAGKNFVPNRENLISRFGDDEDFLFDMISLLLSEIPKRMALVEGAVLVRDASEIEMNSHALKSMLGNFGKSGAYYSAMRIENSANAKELDGIDDLYALLVQEIELLVSQLKDI